MTTDVTADLVDRLTFRWDDALAGLTATLKDVARGAASRAVASVGIDDNHLLDHADELAIDFADERGAELVGMTRTENGTYVPNPSAEWSITEATRDMLRSTVAQAITEGWSTARLRNEILDHTAFSDSRADMIARTEIAFAHEAGNLAGWRASNQVEAVRWLLGSEHSVEDECNDNADDDAVPLGESFSSGDDQPPAHPNCVCALVAVLRDDTEKLQRSEENGVQE